MRHINVGLFTVILFSFFTKLLNKNFFFLSMKNFFFLSMIIYENNTHTHFLNLM